MGILTVIPILAGAIVLKHAGWVFAPFILIHWGTAVFTLLIGCSPRAGPFFAS
jgi:hypothetical protein